MQCLKPRWHDKKNLIEILSLDIIYCHIMISKTVSDILGKSNTRCSLTKSTPGSLQIEEASKKLDIRVNDNRVG